MNFIQYRMSKQHVFYFFVDNNFYRFSSAFTFLYYEFRAAGFAVPERNYQIGVLGQRHLWYIRQYKRSLYSNLLISGKLNGYLADIDRQTEELFSRLVKQMAERESINEKLKAENQMLWVGKINSIREMAMEIVNSDLIYA